MKKKKMEWLEPVVGGVFGVIAIIAAIVEYAMGDGGALAGCIKDISGTIIVVVILVAFLRNIPRKPKNITGLLEKAVEDWGDKNIPLIFKAEDYDPGTEKKYKQGFKLLQDPRTYVKLSNDGIEKGSDEWSKYAKYKQGGNATTGKFLNMPSYKSMTENSFDVLFVMNQSHFEKIDKENHLVREISSAVSRHCANGFQSNVVGASREFKVTCPRIEYKEDVDQFVDMIDYVLSLVKVVA